MTNNDAQKGGAANSLFPKEGPRAVLLCAGPPPEDDLLRYWLTGAEFFICTDAAGHPYDQLPLSPDVVIGDFDSLSGRVLDGRSGPRFLQVDDQYTTDSEKALLFLIEQGIEEVIMLGATGWRLDHTIFNCHLVERYADKLRICIAGPNADTVRLGPDSSVSWDLPAGSRFSLLPMMGPVSGVTLDGARYPLLGDTLEPGGPALISNQVFVSPLLISVGKGSLLVAVDRHVMPLDPGSFGED
jgi:thiamine pyrophosphokinase